MKKLSITSLLLLLLFANAAFTASPLPSWNNGHAKQSIINFMGQVTKLRVNGHGCLAGTPGVGDAPRTTAQGR